MANITKRTSASGEVSYLIRVSLGYDITGKQIVKSMFETYSIPYMSISPISRYCPEHGYVMEHVDKCPICRQRLHKFQRITGYLRDIDNFNRGKANEFKDRSQLME